LPIVVVILATIVALAACTSGNEVAVPQSALFSLLRERAAADDWTYELHGDGAVQNIKLETASTEIDRLVADGFELAAVRVEGVSYIQCDNYELPVSHPIYLRRNGNPSDYVIFLEINRDCSLTKASGSRFVTRP
jgi:hypothetical protein